MSDVTKVPALPSLNGVSDPGTRTFLMAVKEILEVRDGRRGQALDRFVTLRELETAGVVEAGSVRSDGKLEVLAGGGGLDYTSPPALSGLIALGGYAQIFLEWDTPQYSSFSYAEVWRSVTDNVATAEFVGETGASVYSDACGTQKSYFYWVRAVNKAGVVGPYNQIAGTAASTSDDIEYIIDQLTGSALEAQPFYAVTTGYFLGDGVTWVEPGLYVKDARIANGTIKNAMIGTAAIDTAKVSSLSAAKVTFGEMHGDRIQAGTLHADRIQAGTIQAEIGDVITLNANQITTGTLQANTSITAGQGGVVISGDGRIRTYDVSNPVVEQRRYTEMNSGNVTAYEYFPVVGHQAQRALSRVETGIINNGETVVLPGYWVETPKAIVSPASLGVYDRDNYLSDQKIVTSVAVTRISEIVGTADYFRYALTGTAILDIRASGGAATVLSGSVLFNTSSLSGTAQTSPVSVPANSAITVNVKVRGWRVDDRDVGDGEADFWYGNWNVDLILNGVVVHTQRVIGAYASYPQSIPYTEASIGMTSTSAGSLYVRITAYVSGDTKINNNGTVYDHFTSGGPNYAEVTSITASGGTSSGLAEGTLNWVAVGR